MVKNKLLCFWGNIMSFVLTSCGECLEPETTGLA
jgi:hypothetical protein